MPPKTKPLALWCNNLYNIDVDLIYAFGQQQTTGKAVLLCASAHLLCTFRYNSNIFLLFPYNTFVLKTRVNPRTFVL